MHSTRVTYPQGDTSALGTVVRSDPLPDRVATAVVTDLSCFHPLDHTWPDQPADRGQLAGQDVVECLTGAIGPDGELRIGEEIPVRRDDPDWSWHVVHVVNGTGGPAPGDEVSLQVDQQLRDELSAAHTACHLTALALNSACAPLWRKDPGRLDGLGNPDLDALAIERSVISPLTSVDSYRLGKSIRKKGLNSSEVLGQLPELAKKVADQVNVWIDGSAEVSITTNGDDTLAARRTWRCELPEGPVLCPCGGTHVRNLAHLPKPVSVEYVATESGFEGTVSLGCGE